MADTGYKWPAAWTVIASPVVLTQGGVITNTSIVIDANLNAAIMFSIDPTYSNHALATSGLTVSVLKETSASYEDPNSKPWALELPFVQNTLVPVVFALSVSGLHKVKLRLDWGNTTGGSSVSAITAYKLADIPAAS